MTSYRLVAPSAQTLLDALTVAGYAIDGEVIESSHTHALAVGQKHGMRDDAHANLLADELHEVLQAYEVHPVSPDVEWAQ